MSVCACAGVCVCVCVCVRACVCVCVCVCLKVFCQRDYAKVSQFPRPNTNHDRSNEENFLRCCISLHVLFSFCSSLSTVKVGKKRMHFVSANFASFTRKLFCGFCTLLIVCRLCCTCLCCMCVNVANSLSMTYWHLYVYVHACVTYRVF